MTMYTLVTCNVMTSMDECNQHISSHTPCPCSTMRQCRAQLSELGTMMKPSTTQH